MRNPLLPCLAAVLLVSSCAIGPKEFQPQLLRTPGAPPPLQQCAALFPRDRWQFVHSIAFRMADGTTGNALGVLVLNQREIRCALMTVEGLTLFEARSAGEADMEIRRAIPPFDNREFAAGLMRDVRTIFHRPSGGAQYGSLPDGTAVCRYAADSQVTDILPREDGCWRIDTYVAGTKTRAITAQSCTMVEAVVLPHSLELIASGSAGYTLDMRLISAERLPASP